jgi:hypothetical protein
VDLPLHIFVLLQRSICIYINHIEKKGDHIEKWRSHVCNIDKDFLKNKVQKLFKYPRTLLEDAKIAVLVTYILAWSPQFCLGSLYMMYFYVVYSEKMPLKLLVVLYLFPAHTCLSVCLSREAGSVQDSSKPCMISGFKGQEFWILDPWKWDR